MIGCLQCGECCKVLEEVTISKEEYQILKQYGSPTVKPYNDKYKMILPCIFQEGDKCTVWDVRPCMCRMWHCGKMAEGDKILKWMGDIRELMTSSPEYNSYKIQQENDAVLWGNAHGWNWRRS